MISLLLMFTGCLMVSAFLSAAEMAFVSSNQMKMRDKSDEGHEAAQKIVKFYHNPQQFLSTLLIANNIVNVVATAAVALIFEEYLRINNEWIVTLFTMPLLLILGEVVPKDYGRIRSEVFLLRFGSVLVVLVRALEMPVRWMLKLADAVLGRFRSVLHKNIFVSQNELRVLIEESARSGVLNQHERQWINTILDFERIQLSSVMIPIEKISKIDITATVGQVKALVRKQRVRMVLVYEELPTIVVGMVYAYDLLFVEEEGKNLKEFLRSPIFLSASVSIEKAFLTLQQKRQSFAVVLDHQYDAVGAVPIERLIEF